MHTKIDTQGLMDLAASVGKSVARSYPGMDWEDLYSEAMVAAWDPGLKDAEIPLIRTAMKRAAEDFALKERYDYMLATATYVYTPHEVRALLKEAVWNSAEWDVPSGRDDKVSARISKDTVYVSVLDIQKAMKRLNQKHVSVLLSVFRDGEATEDTKSVTRAVEALTRALNWQANGYSSPHEGPGARTAISNAKGQYLARESM